MAEFISDGNRKLIPRWRSSELTTALGELLGPTREPIGSLGADDFSEKFSNWRSRPTLSSAAELVAAAFVHARLDQAKEAADFILRHGGQEPGLLYDLAIQVNKPFDADDPDDKYKPGEQIRWQREMLSVEPRNPFKWVDLARNYLLIGRPRKAMRAIAVALQLAPRDRFVLRSATRLYLHLRQPDRAHHLLNTSDVVPYDPGLIAPEIAVSAITKKTSRLMRRAVALLESKDYAEAQLAELAAVIATEELGHGTGRKARRLFRRSLITPNENVVAQVRWAASETSGLQFDPAYLKVDRSFEARAWTDFYNGDWENALIQSKAWLADQGFSRRPAGLGSFVAAVAMENHTEAIKILDRGLVANPNDGLLLNNLAYSLACDGQIEKAEQAVQRIEVRVAALPEDMSLSITKTATTGLIEYRKGNFHLGRTLYRKAYEAAKNSSLDELRARVAMFFALEEVRAGGPPADPIVLLARSEAGEKATDSVLRLLVGRLIRPQHPVK